MYKSVQPGCTGKIRREAAKAPSLKISSHGTSLTVVDHQDHFNRDECN